IKVWNRSPAKAEALSSEGAVACATASEAMEGCSTIVVCLSNYAAWAGIADDPAVRSALKGSALIQLTGGTVSEAQANAALMETIGTGLIEGAIMCFPTQMGTEQSSIICAGPKDLMEQHDVDLRTMSPILNYLGENYVAPIVMGRASISSILGFLVGTINGAALCQAAGVPLPAYRAQIVQNAELMQLEPLRILDAISSGETEETEASLAVWAGGHEDLLDASRALNVATDFHDGMKEMFELALKAGLGHHDISAMVQAFSAKH
ncbi:MAG: hypothetical protein KJN60_11590, partial [Boseongicola sp.]|nr:hypothetical protein [Boseongicola sp.]